MEKLRNSAVLVTGATGRLGIYIVHALIEASRRFDLNITVYALARNREKIQNTYPQEYPELRVIEQDVVSPIEIDGPVDYIFH